MKLRHAAMVVMGIWVFPVLLFIGGRELVFFTFSDPWICRISPDDSKPSYAVVFNRGALQGASTYLGVLDANTANRDLVVLGPLWFNDIPLSCHRVVISSDKSVVAAESFWRKDPELRRYWLAYDFAQSTRYGGRRDAIDEDPNLMKARAKAIQTLIESHGGIGQEIRLEDIKRDKLSWFAWRRWRAKVDKALTQCRQWDPCDATGRSNPQSTAFVR
jgi:hypothetical protein